jgi:hypothetical protein
MTPRPIYGRSARSEERNIFTLHIVLYQGLHPVAAHFPERECIGYSETQKATAAKLPKRAGATPLFRLSAAQKVPGVTPARSVDACGSTDASIARVIACRSNHVYNRIHSLFNYGQLSTINNGRCSPYPKRTTRVGADVPRTRGLASTSQNCFQVSN